jgi:integrase/recombinase XerC
MKEASYAIDLHHRARWTNAETRRLEAAKAIQANDALALEALLREYMVRKSRRGGNTSERTLSEYARSMRRMLTYLETIGVHLLKADEEALERFVRDLETRLKPNSVDAIWAGVGAFFRSLVWAKVVSVNPWLEVRVADRPANPERPTLDAGQLEHLRTGLPISKDPAIEARDRAILDLGVYAMLRRAEIVGLNLEDVQLAQKRIRVCGKGGKVRLVPLSPTPIISLRNWLMHRQAMVAVGEQAVFVSAHRGHRGQRIGYSSLYWMLQTRLRAGAVLGDGERVVVQGGLHMLRRSGATRHYARNKDLLTLQLVLGHADISTTGIYPQLDDSRVRESLENVDVKSSG